MADVARRRLRRQRNRRRLILQRPILNEEFNDVDFFHRYRFRQGTVHFLAAVFGGLLTYTNVRNQPLTPFLQICVCLRYLAGAGFQEIVGDSLDISKATVCRCIWRVVKLLIIPDFVRRFITFPRSRRQQEELKQGFYRLASKWIFPVLCLHYDTYMTVVTHR